MSRAQEEFDQVNLKYATEDERYYWSVIHHHYIDSHNQFIQSILEFGILGLLVTIAIYLSPLWICWGKREWWLAFFFALISVGQSLFDIFITGQFNILYGILLLMTMKMKADYASPASLSV
jgi:O-antigen ligase